MAQHLTQQGKAYDILNQYGFTLLLNTDPSMAYAVAVAIEGTSAELDVMNGLEQYNAAKLWEALINCSSESLIRLFDYEILAAVNMLTQLCAMDRAKMNTIATQMGYSNVTTLTDVELVDLLISEQRYDEIVSLLLEQFTVSQIPIPSGTSGFSIATFILNIDGYEGFLQALNCYHTEQLKQFFINNPNYKQYLITGSQQQLLLEKLNEQNFVLYLQYVLQQNNINSINYAITNMQTQPVYNYLTWVKTSFGNNAYNNLASNLEFTRTLKLNDWQLYGSSRLGVYNADTTLTNITFTINGIDSNGNFEVNQVISQTNVSVNHNSMQHELAYKQFELTNHLGNVLATVLDRKTNNTADVVTAQHNYPFGSVMSSYKAEEFGYRFGFNGKVDDKEIAGDGNILSYESRILDTRIGRFLSMDPYSSSFPYFSPYLSTGNAPIRFIDKNGEFVIDPETKKTYPVLTNFIQNGGLAAFLNNPLIKKNLLLLGHLTEAQLKTILTNGNGPKILVKTPSYSFAGGEYDANQMTIYINPSLIKLLGSSDARTRLLATIMIGIIIGHETVHYGRHIAQDPTGEIMRSYSAMGTLGVPDKDLSPEELRQREIMNNIQNINTKFDGNEILNSINEINPYLTNDADPFEAGELFEYLTFHRTGITGTFENSEKPVNRRKSDVEIRLENAEQSAKQLNIEIPQATDSKQNKKILKGKLIKTKQNLNKFDYAIYIYYNINYKFCDKLCGSRFKM